MTLKAPLVEEEKKKQREELKQDLELLSKEELIEILLDHEEKRSK